jgi:hypothetical protein
MSDDAALPGTPVDLPLPPALSETFGYRGQARYVALSWSPAGDELVVDDGRVSRSGESWSFQVYKRHKSVGALLAGYNLGSSNRIAEHALILDREANRASVAPVQEALAFVEAQHPPAPPVSRQEAEELRAGMEAFLEQGWRQAPVDPAEIQRAMAEQQGRVGRMISWLDQCPKPPPAQGRGG